VSAARLALVLCALATFAACTPTFTGRLRTRDPHEEKKLETYRSGTIALGVGDMDVRGEDGRTLHLSQTAWFEIVSDQEMRFHVMLSHKHEDLATLEGFRIRLLTDRGHELQPTAVWTRKKIVERHDSTVGVIKAGVSPTAAPAVMEETITRDLHGADTVVVFKHPGLLAKEVRSYSLMLDSPKRKFRFIWDLVPRAELADEE
jgi:hypothetical protein